MSITRTKVDASLTLKDGQFHYIHPYHHEDDQFLHEIFYIALNHGLLNSPNKVHALNYLFKYNFITGSQAKLLAKNLRTWKARIFVMPGDRVKIDRIFTADHRDALVALVQDNRVPVEDAVKTIDLLSQSQAKMIANGYTREEVVNCPLTSKNIIQSSIFSKPKEDYEIKMYAPIHLAIINEQKFVLLKLLDAGANVNEADRDLGRTPLLWAVAVRNLSAVAALLMYQANPDIADCHGTTPLMQTMQNAPTINSLQQMYPRASAAKLRQLFQLEKEKTTEILQILLKNGADKHAKNNVGQDVFQIADAAADLFSQAELHKKLDISATSLIKRM